jgi:phage terminase small subunit
MPRAKRAKDAPLTARQRLFVSEYLVDRVGSDAAIRAGYSPRGAAQQASALLGDERVHKAIAAGLSRVEARAELTIADVVRELRAILEVDPADAIDKQTGAFRPLQEWPKPLRRAVRGIENKEIKGAEGEVIGFVREVKWWSKTEAAQQLLKHLGGFAPQKVDLGGDALKQLADAIRSAREKVEGET